MHNFQGLFWALGCIWLIYRPIKMPHIKGETYTDFNSSYVYVYTDYLPVEFFCNGIISACLTFINVMCIFITAIIVLKVKNLKKKYRTICRFQTVFSSLDQRSRCAVHFDAGTA